MNTILTCPQCQTRLRLRSDKPVQRGKCPRCGSVVTPRQLAVPIPQKPHSSSPEPAPGTEKKRISSIALAMATLGFAVVCAAAGAWSPWGQRLLALRSAPIPVEPATVLHAAGLEDAQDSPAIVAGHDVIAPVVTRPPAPVFSLRHPDRAVAFVREHPFRGERPVAPVLTGTWSGIYFIDSRFQGLRITWHEVDEKSFVQPGVLRLTGTAQMLRFEPVGVRNKNVVVPSPGAYSLFAAARVTAKIHAGSQYLRILLTDITENSGARSSSDFLIEGGLTDDPRSFAGTCSHPSRNRRDPEQALDAPPLNSMSPVVLLPDATGGADLLQRGFDEDQAIHILEPISLLDRRLAVEPGRVATLQKWARQFRVEYPDISLRHTELGMLHRMAANLFEDQHFQSAFGMRFDEMTPRQSEAVGWLIEEISARHLGNLPAEPFDDYQSFARQFQLNGSHSRLHTLALLWQRRVLRTWLKERVAWLRTVEIYRTLPEDIDLCDRAFREHLQGLLPRERVDQACLQEANARVAPAIVEQAVEELLQDPDERWTPHKLSRWRKSAPDAVKNLSAADQERIQGVIDSRIDEVTTQRLQDSVSTLANLPVVRQSLPEIEAVHFYAWRDFDEFGHDPRHHTLASYAVELHAWLAAQVREELSGELAAIGSAEDLDKFEMVLYGVHRGLDPVQERELRAIAGQLRERFARKDRKKYYSGRELSLMNSEDQIQVPVDCPPPSSHEVQLAFIRSHADAFGQQTAPDTLRFETRVQVLLPIRQPYPRGQSSLKINDVELLSTPVKMAGQSCRYTVSYRVRIQQEVQGGIAFDADGQMQRVANLLLRDVAGLVWSDPATDEFVLTTSGWKSPTITQRLNQEGPVMLGKLLNSLSGEPARTNGTPQK